MFCYSFFGKGLIIWYLFSKKQQHMKFKLKCNYDKKNTLKILILR